MLYIKDKEKNTFPKEFINSINSSIMAGFKIIKKEPSLKEQELKFQVGNLNFSITFVNEEQANIVLRNNVSYGGIHDVSVLVNSEEDQNEKLNELIQEYSMLNYYATFSYENDFLHEYEQDSQIIHVQNSDEYESNGYVKKVYNKNGKILSKSEMCPKSNEYKINNWHYDEDWKLIKITQDEKHAYGKYKDKLIAKFEYDLKGNLIRKKVLDHFSQKARTDREDILLYDMNENLRFHKSISRFITVKPVFISKMEIIQNNLTLNQFNENGEIIRKIYVDKGKLVIKEMVNKEKRIGNLFDSDFDCEYHFDYGEDFDSEFE